MKTISSREFNHDVGGAKRAANQGPVVITDRGEPSHVLLSIDTYRALTDPEESLGAAFTGMFDDKLDDVEIPRAMTEKPQAAQLD